jgi:hypothetical protein
MQSRRIAPKELAEQEERTFVELQKWIQLQVENEQVRGAPSAWVPVGRTARAPCLEASSCALLAALNLELAQLRQGWIGADATPSGAPIPACDSILCPTATVALCKNGACGGEKAQILDQWLMANFANPYPGEQQTKELCATTGLTPRQISTWFANARKRKWRPMLEKLFRSHCEAP